MPRRHPSASRRSTLDALRHAHLSRGRDRMLVTTRSRSLGRSFARAKQSRHIGGIRRVAHVNDPSDLSRSCDTGRGRVRAQGRAPWRAEEPRGSGPSVGPDDGRGQPPTPISHAVSTAVASTEVPRKPLPISRS